MTNIIENRFVKNQIRQNRARDQFLCFVNIDFWLLGPQKRERIIERERVASYQSREREEKEEEKEGK